MTKFRICPISKVQVLTQRAQRILDPQTTRTRQVGNLKLLEKCNPMKKQTRPTGLNGSTNLCSGKLKANWPRGLGKKHQVVLQKTTHGKDGDDDDDDDGDTDDKKGEEWQRTPAASHCNIFYRTPLHASFFGTHSTQLFFI